VPWQRKKEEAVKKSRMRGESRSRWSRGSRGKAEEDGGGGGGSGGGGERGRGERAGENGGERKRKWNKVARQKKRKKTRHGGVSAAHVYAVPRVLAGPGRSWNHAGSPIVDSRVRNPAGALSTPTPTVLPAAHLVAGP